MNTLVKFFKDVKKYRHYIFYSARAELKAEVAGSYLNWIWWILDPICMMLIYTFVFGFIFKKTEDYFPVFIFTGLTAWNFFSACLKKAVGLLKRKKSVISRVYVPKTVLLISQMCVCFFKMMISMTIIFIMLLGFRVPFTPMILYAIPTIIVLLIVSFGISAIVMHLGVYITDLKSAIDILLKLVFYATGILFDIDVRIGKNYPRLAAILGKANPMAFLITTLRNALIHGKAPYFKYLFIWLGLGIILSALGVILVYKNENNYVKGI